MQRSVVRVLCPAEQIGPEGLFESGRSDRLLAGCLDEVPGKPNSQSDQTCSLSGSSASQGLAEISTRLPGRNHHPKMGKVAGSSGSLLPEPFCDAFRERARPVEKDPFYRHAITL